jgi:hypothetical protein
MMIYDLYIVIHEGVYIWEIYGRIMDEFKPTRTCDIVIFPYALQIRIYNGSFLKWESFDIISVIRRS